ncbi:MAG TPA: hypothetical protein VK530_00895 [Candidatus Acidoferrum sp.]|nr:hypothetical protein [Candidatus Acidoferrum sp.]
MNTSQPASLRGFGKAALAGLLIVLLFLSALAAGSSSLHQWFHADHNSPTHYCLVSTFEHGHSHITSTAVFVHVAEDFITITHCVEDQSFISIDFTLHSGRGPPVLS